MKRFGAETLPAILLIVVAAGCGDGSASVVGTITLDGQNLPSGANGGLTFLPVNGGPPANSNLSSDGAYQLRIGSQNYLQPGRYRVMITILGPPPSTNENVRPSPGKLLSAQRYRDKDRTEFEVEVKSGKNRFDFDVKRESSAAMKRLPQLVSNRASHR